jgi:membrane protein implicated in regulation of membrane protease activity
MIKTVLTWIIYVILGVATLFIGGGFVMLVLSVGAVALGLKWTQNLGQQFR